MSDYQDITNDDYDDEDETLLEEEEDDADENLDSTSAKYYDKEHLLDHFQKDLTSKNEVYSRLYGDVHQTTHYLTKYEKARIIGTRAQMIADGAPMMVDPGDLKSPIDIARKEYLENKIPILVRRPIPAESLKTKKVEVRRFADLQKL